MKQRKILSNKGFKRMIIKMLTDFKRRMDEHRRLQLRHRKYNKVPKRITELKNKMIVPKTPLEGINSKLDEAEEKFSDLEHRAVNFRAPKSKII